MIIFERPRQACGILPNDFESAMSSFFFSHREIWQPELDSLVREIEGDPDFFNSIKLDIRIIAPVLALRLHGINTNMSCEGHPQRRYVNPAESTSPFVEFGHHSTRKHLNKIHFDFAKRVIPNIQADLRGKGRLLGEIPRTLPVEITHPDQLTSNHLGQETLYLFNSLLYAIEGINQIKTNVEPRYTNSLKLYKEMAMLTKLLVDFYTEKSGHVSALKISEIRNFSAFLGINKSLKQADLSDHQSEFGAFADYLLGRYLTSIGIFVKEAS